MDSTTSFSLVFNLPIILFDLTLSGLCFFSFRDLLYILFVLNFFPVSENQLCSSTSSSFSSESKSNEEQEHVIIARVLASLQSSGSKNFPECDHQHRWQKSTTTSLVSTQPAPGMYSMQYQHCGISNFSPELALHQIWQQEQIMQQMMALTIQPIIPPAPQIYPLMHSVIQPDRYLYFPSKELSSFPVGPNFSIATPRPPFYYSNQIVPQVNTGRSTVTIREIQEEKAEDSQVCNFSNETRVQSPAPENVRQNHGGSQSSSSKNELGGEQSLKSEWDSHRSIGYEHKPINIELQNPSRIAIAHSQASSNRCFRPPAASYSTVRTTGRTSSTGSTVQHREVPMAVAPRLRTGVPQNLGMVRTPTPQFNMAPAVRIRSVVPVCSAPPRRYVAETSKSSEKGDSKPKDK